MHLILLAATLFQHVVVPILLKPVSVYSLCFAGQVRVDSLAVQKKPLSTDKSCLSFQIKPPSTARVRGEAAVPPATVTIEGKMSTRTCSCT